MCMAQCKWPIQQGVLAVGRFIIAKPNAKPKVLARHIERRLPMRQPFYNSVINIVDVNTTDVAKAQILQETGCSLQKSSRQQTTLPQQQERSPQQQHEQHAPAALSGPEEGQNGNRYGKTQPCTPAPGKEQGQSGQYGPHPE